MWRGHILAVSGRERNCRTVFMRWTAQRAGIPRASNIANAATHAVSTDQRQLLEGSFPGDNRMSAGLKPLWRRGSSWRGRLGSCNVRASSRMSVPGTERPNSMARLSRLLIQTRGQSLSSSRAAAKVLRRRWTSRRQTSYSRPPGRKPSSWHLA